MRDGAPNGAPLTDDQVMTSPCVSRGPTSVTVLPLRTGKSPSIDASAPSPSGACRVWGLVQAAPGAITHTLGIGARSSDGAVPVHATSALPGGLPGGLSRTCPGLSGCASSVKRFAA